MLETQTTQTVLKFARFHLVRNVDVSGTSGIGVVAEGVQFSDGRVALRWNTTTRSTAAYDSIADLISIHGHGGRTYVHWIDAPMTNVSDPSAEEEEAPNV